jgi:hypothetical protein
MLLEMSLGQVGSHKSLEDVDAQQGWFDAATATFEWARLDLISIEKTDLPGRTHLRIFPELAPELPGYTVGNYIGRDEADRIGAA